MTFYPQFLFFYFSQVHPGAAAKPRHREPPRLQPAMTPGAAAAVLSAGASPRPASNDAPGLRQRFSVPGLRHGQPGKHLPAGNLFLISLPER